MTSFSWKRKAGGKVSREKASAFEADAKGEEDNEINSGEVDWLTLVKKPRIARLEDGVSKAKRLREEGSVLAQDERFWEALKKWQEALAYTPSDEVIFEMKAQALMQLGEVHPAVQAAERAVFLNPKWWVAHQTLGRSLMGIGEVQRAIRSFSRAIVINPCEQELWEEDLKWAKSLIERRKETLSLKEQQETAASCANIIELEEDKNIIDNIPDASSSSGKELSQNFAPPVTSLKKLPVTYVCLRE